MLIPEDARHTTFMATHFVRFAPSPTGDLHLGHAYSALYAWHKSGQSAERFHLRIDDLDHTRCREPFIKSQIEDLRWLGISWQAEPLLQSQRLHRYQDALSYLKDKHLLYPCYLSRREVDAILSAPQEAGDLKHALSDEEMQDRQDKGTEPAWRIDMAICQKTLPQLTWFDAQKGPQNVNLHKLSDVIIARRDIGASYDLSVVLDDFDTGISLVTRGEDLFQQTHLHRLLQHLLGLPSPLYDHHKLITDDQGKRLAKRDDARSIHSYRMSGKSADIIKTMLMEKNVVF